MKFVWILCTLPVLTIAQIEMASSEKDCVDKEGASEEDVEMFRAMIEPEERTTKCYYSCMFQILRFSDGKRFDREGYLSHSDGMSERKRQTMVEIADDCEGTENDDHCELAADIVRCTMNSK